jgi:hypothetical protein
LEATGVFFSTLFDTAGRQSVNVVGGIGRAAKNVATETGGVIHDAGVLSFEVATGIDTGVQLWSQTSQLAAARMAAGESVLDITQDIGTQTGLNFVTFGSYGVMKEQLSATADYVTGRETLEGLETRLADAAGGAVLNAALAAAASTAPRTFPSMERSAIPGRVEQSAAGGAGEGRARCPRFRRKPRTAPVRDGKSVGFRPKPYRTRRGRS